MTLFDPPRAEATQTDSPLSAPSTRTDTHTGTVQNTTQSQRESRPNPALGPAVPSSHLWTQRAPVSCVLTG